MALIIMVKNISNLAPVSDYEYKVLIGDGSRAGSRIVEEGKLFGHKRERGWRALIDQLIGARL